MKEMTEYGKGFYVPKWMMAVVAGGVALYLLLSLLGGTSLQGTGGASLETSISEKLTTAMGSSGTSASAGSQSQQAGSGGSGDGIQTGQVPVTTPKQEKSETSREEVIEEIKDLIIKDATLKSRGRTILGRIEDKNSVILSLPAKNSVFSTEDQSFYFSKIERKGDTIQGKIENRGSKKRWVSIESYVIVELEGKHDAGSREVKMGLKEWDTDYYIYSNWEMEPANEYGANEYGFVIKRIPAQYRVSYVILTIGGYKERRK